MQYIHCFMHLAPPPPLPNIYTWCSVVITYLTNSNYRKPFHQQYRVNFRCLKTTLRRQQDFAAMYPLSHATINILVLI